MLKKKRKKIVGSTALIVVPGTEPTGADFAAIGAKLAKLAKGNKLLIEIGSMAKLSQAVREIEVTVKGIKYSVAGSKIARAAELGIMQVDFVAGEVRTAFKELSEWFLKYGDAAIVRLKGLGATNDMLEVVIKKGGNLEKTINLKKSVKGVTWLEEGTDASGWLHIYNKHVVTGEFRSIGIADDMVQPKIFETIQNPTKGILNSPSGGWCFFANAGTKFIKAVVGSNGYIVTAYPTTSFTCT